MNIFTQLFILYKCVTANPLILNKLVVQFKFSFIEHLIYQGLQDFVRLYRDYDENDRCRLSVTNAYNTLMQEFPQTLMTITQFKCSKNDSTDYYYQYKLFNTQGMLSYMFQFLDLQSLIQCSFANSIWLYDAFDPNSIYHYNYKPSSFQIATMKRRWFDRLSKVQYLVINCDLTNFSIAEKIEPFFLSLKNVKKTKLIINLNSCSIQKLRLLNNLLVQKKSKIHQSATIIQLNLGGYDQSLREQTDPRKQAQDQMCHALFRQSIHSKDITLKNVTFIKPHEIFGKINTAQQLKQNGIECGVDGRCSVGWKRPCYFESDKYSDTKEYEKIGIASVSALMINDKAKKIFVAYCNQERGFTLPNSAPLLFNTANRGEWHQLPNDNLYPCPKKNDYHVRCNNLIHRMYEQFDKLEKLCITIDETTYTCKNWLFDLLNTVKEINLQFVLIIDCLRLNDFDSCSADVQYCQKRLDLIRRIFVHVRELIQNNVIMDIKISYSTFSFDQCHTLFLKIFSNGMIKQMVSHEYSAATKMTVFRACFG